MAANVKNKEYKIWRCNMWDDDMLTDLVAIFYSLELAEDFVSYQASIGNNYAIMCDGKRIE